MTTTTRSSECSASAPRLLMALELGRRQWVIGFTTTPGSPVRQRTLRAEDWQRLPAEMAAAKARFGLPPDAPVESCYEAGPDGFWVHRYLTQIAVTNRVVESSSIEVNRRARRAKTDGLDVRKLGTMLYRVLQGEVGVWREVRVPRESDEDGRQPHRELRALKRDRTRVTNRIGGLLATQGITLLVRADFGDRLAQVRDWRGEAMGAALHARLQREWAKVVLLTAQIQAVQRARRARLQAPPPDAAAAIAQVRQLVTLRGIGEHGAWLLVMEVFAWRQIRNRRQLGGLTGLTGTPWQSGTLDRDQGISRAGNAQIRAIAIELAWCWLQYQPASALAQWYQQRYAQGGPRARKVGIVAVARRLVIALWRYLDAGVIPDGAVFKPSGDSQGVHQPAA
ncbi:MAG: IS110 family transposase [Acidobacteriota bacterium]